MKTTINGNQVIVKFRYSEPTKHNNHVQKQSFVSVISLDGTEIHSTQTVNSFKVPFSYANGRKRAVKKLLSELRVPRLERKVVWYDLFAQCPNTVPVVSMKSEKIKKVVA
jgi:hypothetical protein